MLIRLATPRNRRPNNAPLRVRRGHPLARDLRACIMLGGNYGFGRDLVTGALFSPTNSPAFGVTREGLGVDFTGTAYVSAPDVLEWNVLGPVSIGWRGVIRSPTTHGVFIQKPGAGGGGGSNTPFALEYNNASSAGLLFVRSNSNFRTWRGADNKIVANTQQVVSASQNGLIETTPVFYVDGVADTVTNAYGSSGSGAPTTNTNALQLGRRADGFGQQDGLTNLMLVAAVEWDVRQHMLWATDGWGVVEEAPRWYYGDAGGALNDYTLALDPGAFTLSGQAVGLRAARRLDLGAGAVALTGQAVSLLAARRLALAAGSVALTGQDVALRRGYRLDAAAGSFAVSGQSVSLRAARRLALEAGAFTLSGQAVGLRAGRRLAAESGAFAVDGLPVSLLRGYLLSAGVGTFALSGQAVALIYSGAQALPAGRTRTLRPRWSSTRLIAPGIPTLRGPADPK